MRTNLPAPIGRSETGGLRPEVAIAEPTNGCRADGAAGPPFRGMEGGLRRHLTLAVPCMEPPGQTASARVRARAISTIAGHPGATSAAAGSVACQERPASSGHPPAQMIRDPGIWGPGSLFPSGEASHARNPNSGGAFEMGEVNQYERYPTGNVLSVPSSGDRYCAKARSHLRPASSARRVRRGASRGCSRAQNDEGPRTGGLRHTVREGGLEPPRPLKGTSTSS